MSCNSPLYMDVRGTLVPVPCRWCLGCRIDRRNLWSMRLRFEVSENYKKKYGSSFVTLTYSDEHNNPTRTLVKEDVQKFIKRLRYYLKKYPNPILNPNFKYYCVGEYGSETQRNHYHIVFTGLESNWLRTYVRKSWSYGQTKVDVVNNTRINYLLKYMDKQIFNTDTYTTKDGREVLPPFAIFSKGIGSESFRASSRFALDNGIIRNGTKYVKFPSYYAKKFGVDTEVLKKVMLDNVKAEADKRGLTLKQYSDKKHYYDELKKVSSARLGKDPVSTVGLDYAQRTFDKRSYNLTGLLSEVEND